MKQKPYDPSCDTFAENMPELDDFIYDFNTEKPTSLKELSKNRENYIINNEGTYNPETDHFLCDKCYIKAGMPTSPEGWKCP